MGCTSFFLGTKRPKMPGVLIDENPFGLENLNSGGGGGSIYDFVGYSSSSPLSSHSQSSARHTMRRLSSFSAGMKDSEPSSLGLSQSVPNVYQRSHSFGNNNTGSLHAFNFFGSPPDSPAKSDLGMSFLDGVEESFGDGGSGKGLFEGGGKGGSGHGCSDLRSLSFGGSAMMSGSVVGSPTFPDSVVHSFNKFLPCNNEDEEAWSAVDMYGCDQFRMFEFKVRRCMRGRSHDWTECPFAHPGEKARRRDPRRFHYSGTACPDFRKGTCRRGDACEYAHGVFECWLHPARYRTQPCKDGRNCRRRVCFFAHTPEQLRLLPAAAQAATVAARSGGGGGLVGSQASALSAASTYDGCPVRGGAYDGAFVYERSSSFDGSSHSTNVGSSALSHFNGFMSPALSGHCCLPSQISSPTSTLVGHAQSPPPLSPPLSPSGSPPHSPSSPSPHGGWPSSMAPSFASLSSAGQAAMSQALTQASLQASLSEGVAYTQAQATLARSQNSNQGMVGVGGTRPHSPSTPAHRRHLDRLNSMPTLSIPSERSLQQLAVGLSGSAPVSPAGGHHQSKSMLELVATLQQLELGGSTSPSTQWLQQHYTSGPSPLRHCSVSVPGTPTKVHWEQKERWEYDENEEDSTVQRVESGRDLRAKIYGCLGKENPMEAGNVDAPDLGWVNELVKEEPEQTPTW